MARYFGRLVTILLFLLMLLFPGEVFSGASEGLLLWFHVVLPTLLPFVILSGLLIRTRAIDWIVRVTGPVLRGIFGVSDYGSFAVVAGFLCGYPMGSKVTADLVTAGHISIREGEYLLSFCNNASPAFIVSYVAMRCLRREELAVPALVILTGAPVLASFLFRPHRPGPRAAAAGTSRTMYTPNPAKQPSKRQSKQSSKQSARQPTAEAPASGGLIDSCIMNGFETITKVGGYIMLFSILVSLAGTAHIEGFLYNRLLLPALEVTNGVSMLCGSGLPEKQIFFLCMVHTSFGGLCAAAQTRCMIAGTGLSVKPYLAKKLITALVTSFLTALYLRYMYQ